MALIKRISATLSWRPSQTFNGVLSAGLRKQLDGDKDLKPYVRASADLLSPWTKSKWWEPEHDLVLVQYFLCGWYLLS